MKQFLVSVLCVCFCSIGVFAQSATIGLEDAIATNGAISVSESGLSKVAKNHIPFRW